MDFSSVVKADRDLSISKSKDANAPYRTLFGASVTSASSSAVDDSKQDVKTNQEGVVSKLNEKNSWDKESFTSQASIQKSTLVKDSENVEELRKERDKRNEEEKERRLEEAHNKAKEVIDSLNQKQLALQFATSEDFDDTRVINVVDAKSKEVIRQIPSDEFLRIAQSIKNYEQRLAHDDMVGDPSLKAKGVDPTGVNESLRGVVFDTIA